MSGRLWALSPEGKQERMAKKEIWKKAVWELEEFDAEVYRSFPAALDFLESKGWKFTT